MKKHILATLTAIAITSNVHAENILDTSALTDTQINTLLNQILNTEKGSLALNSLIESKLEDVIKTKQTDIIKNVLKSESGVDALKSALSNNKEINTTLTNAVTGLLEGKESSDILKNVLNSETGEKALKDVLSNNKNINKSLTNAVTGLLDGKDSTEILKNAIAETDQFKSFTSHLDKQVADAQLKQDQMLSNIESNIETQFQNFAGVDPSGSNSLVYESSKMLLPMGLKALGLDAKAKDTARIADRHVYFSTTAGYQFSPTASKKRQQESYDFSQKDNMTTNFALGIYFKDNSDFKSKTDYNAELTNANAFYSELLKEPHLETQKNIIDLKKESNPSTLEIQKQLTLAYTKLIDASKNDKEKAALVNTLRDIYKHRDSIEKAFHETSISYKRGYALQAEYSEIRTKTSSQFEDLKDRTSAQKNVSLVGLVPILPTKYAEYLYDNFDTHVYGVVGAGYTTIKGANEDNVDAGIKYGTFEDSSAILGVGYSKGLNSSTQIIGEARAVYNINDNYWQTQLMAGIRVGIGQFMSKYVP